MIAGSTSRIEWTVGGATTVPLNGRPVATTGSQVVKEAGTLPSDLVTAGYIGTALALVSGLDVDAALAVFGVPLGALGGILWYVRMTAGSVLVCWAKSA